MHSVVGVEQKTWSTDYKWEMINCGQEMCSTTTDIQLEAWSVDYVWVRYSIEPSIEYEVHSEYSELF